MKRYGNLKQQWCNYEALLKAFFDVKLGKSTHYEVIEYEMNLVSNLVNLLHRLETGSYQPKPLRVFYINIPKKRLIQAPAFEDRIVHHALMNVIEPIIDRRLIDTTYACRKGKGVLSASNRLQGYIRESKFTKYLKLDIQKFFYSINHQALELELRRIIKDERTISLIQKFYHGTIGLPLGNVTSQMLANLALNPIDQFIKRELKCKYYIRYMDDIIILGQSESFLRRIWEKVSAKLSEIKLNLNSKSHIGNTCNGIDFVGFRTWESFRLIRKKTLYTVGRKIKKFHRWDIINSYLAHAKHSNSINYVADVVAKNDPIFIPQLNNWLRKNEVKYAIL